MRHVLYDRLAPSRRARVHRRLAELLEPSGDAAEIARQYHASAALPGADKGVPFALAAARRADPAGAVQLLTLALDLGIEDRLRAQVVSELALAYAASGRPTDAVLTLTGAVEEMERLGAPGGEIATVVYRVLSLVLDGLGSPVSLEPLLARALAALGRERGLGWARLKLLERPVETVPAGPIRITRFGGLDPDAVRMACGEGGEADEAMAVDEWVQWPLERLQGYGRRVRAWSDPDARVRALITIAMALAVGRWAGASAQAEPLCDEIEGLAEPSGPARAIATVLRGAVHGSRGELGAATEALTAAEARAAQLGRDHRAHVLLALVRGLTLQHVDGAWADLGELAVGLACRREPGPWPGHLWGAIAAQAFARAGLEGRARTLLADVAPVLAAADAWEVAQGGAVSFAAEAAWILDARAPAEPLLAPALALVEADAGDFYMASSQLTLARLYAVLGHWDDAESAFARAREDAQLRELWPLRAITDHDRGPRAPAGGRGRRGRVARARGRALRGARDGGVAAAAGPRHAAGRADRARGRGAAARRRRADEQGDRFRARAQRPHGRAPPRQRVPQDVRPQPGRRDGLRAQGRALALGAQQQRELDEPALGPDTARGRQGRPLTRRRRPRAGS